MAITTTIVERTGVVLSISWLCAEPSGEQWCLSDSCC